MGAPATTATSAEGDEPTGGTGKASATASLRPSLSPKRRGPAAFRFAARNEMLTTRYARHLATYLRHRLRPGGSRLKTDGMVFLCRGLELQIGPRSSVSLGRFVWIGDRSKIRCHEGSVEIGAKTVIGQECTISAYRRVRIGEQCVIADRAMFIDFDHNVSDTERPIRVQGIYTRDVEVGSNVWIGYGAQILRGVRIGDNAIIGSGSVVTRDIPANAVAAGIPARVIRMREAPSTLQWANPVEPEGYGPPGPR